MQRKSGARSAPGETFGIPKGKHQKGQNDGTRSARTKNWVFSREVVIDSRAHVARLKLSITNILYDHTEGVCHFVLSFLHRQSITQKMWKCSHFGRSPKQFGEARHSWPSLTPRVGQEDFEPAKGFL